MGNVAETGEGLNGEVIYLVDDLASELTGIAGKGFASILWKRETKFLPLGSTRQSLLLAGVLIQRPVSTWNTEL